MKILFLSQRFLFPMDTGGKIRTGNILRQLQNLAEITVISNIESPKDDGFLTEMNPLCQRFVPVPWKEMPRYTIRFYVKLFFQCLSRYPVSVLNDYSRELEDAVCSELKKNTYDLVICDFLQSTLNFKQINNIPILLFQHNVEATITKRHVERAKNPVSRFFWWMQHQKLSRHEEEMCTRFDSTIAVSQQDKEWMEEWYQAKNVRVIPTGVDTAYYQTGEVEKEKKQLVFTGSMDWLPNEDAMIFFVEKIFPKIKEKEPDTRLVVVGRRPTPKLETLAKGRDDVVLTGWVEDTRPYIHESAVFIVPIRIGGGTRMKIYEALAMGKAMVSTKIGAEGLPLTHEKHLFLADEEESFSEHVVQLLRDVTLRKTMGKEARSYVYKNFRWEQVAKVFYSICQETAKHKN